MHVIHAMFEDRCEQKKPMKNIARKSVCFKTVAQLEKPIRASHTSDENLRKLFRKVSTCENFRKFSITIPHMQDHDSVHTALHSAI
jgi:hypothetical protein